MRYNFIKLNTNEPKEMIRFILFVGYGMGCEQSFGLKKSNHLNEYLQDRELFYNKDEDNNLMIMIKDGNTIELMDLMGWLDQYTIWWIDEGYDIKAPVEQQCEGTSAD